MGGSSTTSRNKVHLTMYRRCGRDRGSERNAVMYRLRHVPRCTEPEKWWAAAHSCAPFDFGQLSASALGVAVLLGIQVRSLLHDSSSATQQWECSRCSVWLTTFPDTLTCLVLRDVLLKWI